MDNEKTLEEIGRRLVAKIVSSYVTHNRVAANELPSVITSVHQAVSSLEKRASSVEPLTPAVPVRYSVRTDYVVCLECGFRSRALRRHLRTQHGLERAEYYARWQLPPDHQIIALVGGAAPRTRNYSQHIWRICDSLKKTAFHILTIALTIGETKSS